MSTHSTHRIRARWHLLAHRLLAAMKSRFVGVPSSSSADRAKEKERERAELESRVLEALMPTRRLLLPEVLAAILECSRPDVDEALESLRSRRLVSRNRCGQWWLHR